VSPASYVMARRFTWQRISKVSWLSSGTGGRRCPTESHHQEGLVLDLLLRLDLEVAPTVRAAHGFMAYFALAPEIRPY
jgi:hypothetical protein